MPQPHQVFGPVVTLEGLPQYTRDALSRALASWRMAAAQSFGPAPSSADLSEVHAAREAFEGALWLLGPIALPGASFGSQKPFLPSIFSPGEHLLLSQIWAVEQALQAAQETPQEALCSR